MLVELGKESGRLALGRCRGNAQGGGKGAAGKRVPGSTTAPTATVVPGADKAEKAAGGQTARPMVGKMTPKDQEICNQNNICERHAITVRRLQIWSRLQGVAPVGRGTEKRIELQRCEF